MAKSACVFLLLYGSVATVISLEKFDLVEKESINVTHNAMKELTSKIQKRRRVIKHCNEEKKKCTPNACCYPERCFSWDIDVYAYCHRFPAQPKLPLPVLQNPKSSSVIKVPHVVALFIVSINIYRQFEFV